MDVSLSNADRAHIKEALEACQEELLELYRTKDWFVSDALDLIESSLEILNHRKEE